MSLISFIITYKYLVLKTNSHEISFQNPFNNMSKAIQEQLLESQQDIKRCLKA